VSVRGFAWVEGILGAAQELAHREIAKSHAPGLASKGPTPCLVGEVREATTGTGFSWKIIGGSQWFLCAVTNVSK